MLGRCLRILCQLQRFHRHSKESQSATDFARLSLPALHSACCVKSRGVRKQVESLAGYTSTYLGSVVEKKRASLEAKNS